MSLCKSVMCLATVHDNQPDEVMCDSCDEWYHTMCEALTFEEEVNLGYETVGYICIKCRADEAGKDVRKCLKDSFYEKCALLINTEKASTKSILDVQIIAEELNLLMDLPGHWKET